MGGYGRCSCGCVILQLFLLLGIMATVSALYPQLPMNLNFTEICTLALNIDCETLKRTNLFLENYETIEVSHIDNLFASKIYR